MITINKSRRFASLGVLAALGATVLTGCIIDSSSGPPPPICTADMTVSWDIADLDGVPLACEEVPATTVDIQLSGVSHPFSCNGYAATITDIPLGNYTARLQLFDGSVLKSSTQTMNISFRDCILYDLNAGAPVPFEVQ